jgi:hypothetical protein
LGKCAGGIVSPALFLSVYQNRSLLMTRPVADEPGLQSAGIFNAISRIGQSVFLRNRVNIRQPFVCNDKNLVFDPPSCNLRVKDPVCERKNLGALEYNCYV